MTLTRRAFSAGVGMVIATPTVAHDRLLEVANGFGSVAVGPNTKRILSFEFQEIGHLIEDIGYRVIVHERARGRLSAKTVSIGH